MPSAIRRIMRLIVLFALAVVAFMLIEYVNDRSDERQLQAGYRVPEANPPLEPDRPDLFEEPRIDEHPR